MSLAVEDMGGNSFSLTHHLDELRPKEAPQCPPRRFCPIGIGSIRYGECHLIRPSVAQRERYYFSTAIGYCRTHVPRLKALEAKATDFATAGGYHSSP